MKNHGNSKCDFLHCEEHRNAAGLSKAKLAREAGVSVDLVRSLERGNYHSRHRVVCIFNELQKRLNKQLDPNAELSPP